MHKKFRFTHNIYTDEYYGNKIKKACRMLNRRSLFLSAFVLILPENKADQIEIINSRLLRQSYYEKNIPLVVGFAKDYDSACSLITDLAQCAIAKYGNADIKKYILDKESEV